VTTESETSARRVDARKSEEVAHREVACSAERGRERRPPSWLGKEPARVELEEPDEHLGHDSAAHRPEPFPPSMTSASALT